MVDGDDRRAHLLGTVKWHDDGEVNVAKEVMSFHKSLPNEVNHRLCEPGELERAPFAPAALHDIFVLRLPRILIRFLGGFTLRVGSGA